VVTAANTPDKVNTKVVTGKVRLSYVHVWEPFTNNPTQEAKYSCVLLIPKTDKVTIKALRAAQQAALVAGKDSKFGGKIPAVWADTIHDGDEEADLDQNPEYAGHMYMSVSSKTKPGVVDANVQPILDSTEVYSGCYARASINCFPYNFSGKKSVSFGLNHIQKLSDGDSLMGMTKAEDDFDAVDEDESII
jgi:hypothetical protein